MNNDKRRQIFARLQAANPHPTTELNYSSEFELLVAVLLSAQATDVGVNKATDKLFPVANTPEAILALGQEGLESYIATIGLYRSKARHLLQTCQLLIDQHAGQVPRSREALQAHQACAIEADYKAWQRSYDRLIYTLLRLAYPDRLRSVLLWE